MSVAPCCALPKTVIHLSTPKETPASIPMKASSMTISWTSSCMSEKAAHDAIADR